MRILFIGDVVGRTGREAVATALPRLRAALRLDLGGVNAENASHGFGLAPDMAEALFAAGADVLTLGNHAWDRREIIPYIADHPRLIRPLNYPPGAPGAGSAVVELPDGRRALVVQTMGRLYMDPLDCPFRATAELLSRYRLGGTVAAIVADFHAEATSEKMAYAHSFDGQVSLVVGTHTHCPSADHQVLPGGTAFQSDAGMSGDYDSVIGMVKEPAAIRFWRKMPGERLAPAGGPATPWGGAGPPYPFATNAANASPTSAVPAWPPMSRVRGPPSRSRVSTAATIAWPAAASPRCSSISPADQIWPIGLQMCLPAISGAEPCTGSNIEGKMRSGLMLAEGAMPIEPATAGPRSDRMSPNRFDPTTTSNQSGCCTKCAARISTWNCARFTPGYSCPTAANR